MTSIHDLSIKIKDFLSQNKSDFWIYVVVIFVGILAFFLGRVSQNELDNNNIYIVNSSGEVASVVEVFEKENILANSDSTFVSSVSTPDIVKNNSGSSLYVASSRGKLYYRIGCGDSTKLVESNKLYFNTKEQAEQKGYKPAANCAP